jgi:sulfur carrier protein ThiS
MTMPEKSMENLIDVKISFTGVIDIKNISDGSIIQIEKDSTVDDILNRLGIKKPHRKYLIVIINEEKKRASYILQNNDHLNLFLPVGGG